MPRIVQSRRAHLTTLRLCALEAEAADIPLTNDRQKVLPKWLPAHSLAGLQRWCDSTLVMGLLSGVLMWLAVPPVDWGLLGWVAPLGWLLLIRRTKLNSWRPYVVLYGLGWIYFGATFYWIMLPHILAIFGWIALTTYLACYLPLFIGFTRCAVHRLKIPLLFAAPLVWTGLEYFRGHLVTGFLMAALGHTQHGWLEIIQLSDLFGAYAVTFLVMLVAAALASLISYGGARPKVWPLLLATMAMLGAFFYGQYRLASEPGALGPRVALIQGSVDTRFDRDPQETQQLIDQEYLRLTREALRDPGEIKMIVWPESMSTVRLIKADEDGWLPASEIADWNIVEPKEAILLEKEKRLPEVVYQLQKYSERRLAQLMQELHQIRSIIDTEPFVLVVGTDVEHYQAGTIDRYNSSLALGAEGEVRGRYDKMHLVMFGEYIPFGEMIPALYDWTPLTGGLTPGKHPSIYEVAGRRFAPNICYETVLPHVIRRQLLELESQQQSPDVLLSQTNDGWFWGSSALDMHLICGVFRAVEFRTPLLIAANTGLSASIDGRGNVQSLGPRRKSKMLLVEPRLEPLQSFYLKVGDLLGGSCAVFVCFVGLWMLFLWRKPVPVR